MTPVGRKGSPGSRLKAFAMGSLGPSRTGVFARGDRSGSRDDGHHRMADKNRAQTRCLIELGFKRKNTEHQINGLSHLRNATLVPRPNLRADVINNFQLRKFCAQRMGQTQIKTWVMDQDYCAWLHGITLRNGCVNLLAKKGVLTDYYL